MMLDARRHGEGDWRGVSRSGDDRVKSVISDGGSALLTKEAIQRVDVGQALLAGAIQVGLALGAEFYRWPH